MLRSILLAYEPSVISLSAAELTQRLAVEFQATVSALGVFDETIVAPSAVPLGGQEQRQARDHDLMERDRKIIRSGLDAVDARLSDAGVAHHVLLRSGTPHELILEQSQSCDLIVLGSEDASDIGIGESASQILWEVLRVAPRPVVAVPDKFREGSGVLVAYDGRVQASRTLYALQASGLARLGPVHVVSVDSESAEKAAARTGFAIEYLASHEVAATPHAVVTEEDKSAAILAEAERLGVGLIAMGCLGRGVVREFLTGSTTANMVRQSPYPLFLFR